MLRANHALYPPGEPRWPFLALCELAILLLNDNRYLLSDSGYRITRLPNHIVANLAPPRHDKTH